MHSLFEGGFGLSLVRLRMEVGFNSVVVIDREFPVNVSHNFPLFKFRRVCNRARHHCSHSPFRDRFKAN